MKLIKDLGYTDLGKYSKKRYFVVAECPICLSHVTMRKDRLKTTKCCRKCTNELHSDKAKIAAKERLKDGTLTCTKCKETLPLASFNKDKSKLSGYRSVCKTCRYESEKETNSKYLKSDAGKSSSANRRNKRRALLRSGSDNSITANALEKLRKNQNYMCYYCEVFLDTSIPYFVHLDHIVPISKGGKHTLSNVVWSCQKCNLTKSNTLIQFS